MKCSLAQRTGKEEHTVNHVPKTTCYVGLFSQRCRLFGQGNNVDIVGVTGSIPVTPTILFKHLAAKYEALLRFIEPGRLRNEPPVHSISAQAVS